MKIDNIKIRVNGSNHLPAAVSKPEPPKPTNQYLVDLTKSYEKYLGKNLTTRIQDERSFMLREVIPAALAKFNATEDARQILEGVLPKASGFVLYQRMALDALDLGLKIKLINHTAKSLGLSEQDRQLMLFTTLAPKEVSIKQLLGDLGSPKNINPLTNEPRIKKPRQRDTERNSDRPPEKKVK